jgi:hypothetical protein
MARYREKVVPAERRYLGTYYWKWTYEGEDEWKLMTSPFYFNPYPNRSTISTDRAYDTVHKGPPYTDGGPFDKWHFHDHGLQPTKQFTTVGVYGSMMRKYVGCHICSIEPWTIRNDMSYTGGTYKVGHPDVVTQPALAGWGDPEPYGATAWNRFKPGKSLADAGVFIGEMKEIPRMLMTTAGAFRDRYFEYAGRGAKKSAHAASKEAANHWLNHQYGWLPFLSDLRKFVYAWQNADSFMQQLKRDNGKWIRRYGSVMTENKEPELYKTENTLRVYPWYTTAVFPDYNKPGKTLYTRYLADKVWFSAKFRYYIPDIGSVVWKANAMRKLYGASLNPGLVWELVPWSWLIDWFSNWGDVLGNLDNELAENLAAKYAFVMRTRQEYVGVKQYFNTSSPFDHTFFYEIHRKCRKQANPFGFGLTWDDLSLRQWSILGALGITRSRY